MNIYVAGPIGYEKCAELLKEHRPELLQRFPLFYINKFESIGRGLYQIADSAKIADSQKNDPALAAADGGLLLPIGADGRFQFPIDADGKLLFPIEAGGLFGALWTAMETVHKGCEIMLRDIPVHQEIIEIMELYGENPYESSSDGAWLVLSELNPWEINKSHDTRADILKNDVFHGKTSNGNKLIDDALNCDASNGDASDSNTSDVRYTLIGYTTDKKDRVVVLEDQRRFLTPLKRQLKDIADRQRIR